MADTQADRFETLARYADVAHRCWTPDAKRRAAQVKTYLTEQVIKDYHLGYAPSLEQLGKLDRAALVAAGLVVQRNGSQQPFFRDRIVIPVFWQGDICYMTGRRLAEPVARDPYPAPKTLSLPAPSGPDGVGLSRPPGFNLDILDNLDLLLQKGVLVVEGPLDAVATTMRGVPAVAFMGGSLKGNERLLELLRKAQGQGVAVYLALDGTKDVTAEKRLLEASAIGPNTLVCVLPQDQDPDDLMVPVIEQLKHDAKTALQLWCLEMKKPLEGLHYRLRKEFLEIIQTWVGVCNAEDFGTVIDEFGYANDLPTAKIMEMLELAAPAPEPTEIGPDQPEVEEAVVESPPENKGSGKQSEQPLISNCNITLGMNDEGKMKPVRHRKPLADILTQASMACDDWPRRTAAMLFIDRTQTIKGLLKHEIQWLADDAQLFAYYHSRAGVQWPSGLDAESQSLLTKKELISELRITAPKYDSVEMLPHEPLLPNTYYAWEPDPDYEASGAYFNRLLKFFGNAETTADRDLIKALFMTPCAGLLAGQRPGFAVMAPDRKCGKSTLAECAAVLYGGLIDIRLTDQYRDEDIATRLLTPSTVGKRVVRIDNVKGVVKSATVEGLITSPEVSGRQLYVGNSERPNVFTYVFTGNGLMLGTDIASRCYIIRLVKPPFIPDWKEEVHGFITKFQKRIIADIILALRQPYTHGLYDDRWSTWCRNVLGRASKNPDEVIKLTKERRAEVDEEIEEAAVLTQAIDDAVADWQSNRSNALQMQYEGEDNVFIRVAELTVIIREALNLKHLGPHRASWILKHHIEAGRLPRVRHHVDENKVIGYLVLLKAAVEEPATPPDAT